MKRFLLFLMFALFGLFVNAQTDVLDIAGVEVVPEETATKYYYVKNVGTGLYMSYGGAWSTNCIETSAAHPIAVETNGDYVALGSLMGYMSSNGMWMDWAKSSSQWKLEKVTGYTNQYYIVNAYGEVISSEGSAAGVLTQKFKMGVDAKSVALQRWVFLTEEDIRGEQLMGAASAEHPVDITPFIKSSTFDRVDQHAVPQAPGDNPNAENPDIMDALLPYNGAWEGFKTHAKWEEHCYTGDWVAESYNGCGIVWAADAAREVKQVVTLPAGTYHFSFEAFYNCVKTVSVQKQTRSFDWGSFSYTDWSNNGDPNDTNEKSTMTASVSVAGVTVNIPQGDDTEYNNFDNGGEIAVKFRDSDDYKQHGTFYLAEETEVEFVVSIGALTAWNQQVTAGGGATSTSRTLTTTWYSAQVCLDEFTLTYYGEEEIAHKDVSHTAHYEEYLNANIEEIRSMFCDEAKAVFNEQVSGITTGSVETLDDFSAAINTISSAYNAAKIVHDQSTGKLVNPSFETGDLTGWSVGEGGGAADTGVRDFATTGMDGTKLFNSWWQGVPVYQTVSGLPNGRYLLEALLASGDAGNDGTVYLFANDEKLGVNPPSGGGQFGDYDLRFTVSDGTAKVGAIGGADDDTPENPVGSYVEAGHWWYKADNFRLTYLGEILDMKESDSSLNYDEGQFFAYARIDRKVSSDNWSTLLLPFDMPIPEGWTVKQLTDDTHISGSALCLRFEDATSMKAGVPYLVRHTLGETVSLPSVDDVVMTKIVNTASVSGCVDLCGTYTAGVIPAGAFYLSGNKFYKATTDIPTKGFRAYFMPKSSEVKSLGFDFDEDFDFTAIEGVEDVQTVEPVAIYGADGTIRYEMQKGLNIVKMSDGTVQKIMVK